MMRALIALGLLGVVLAVVLQPSRVEAKDPEGACKCAPALKIGFVDVKEVFEKYQRTKESEGAINRAYEERKKELAALAEKTRTLEQELDLYAPGSKMRAQKGEELYLLRRKYEFQRKWAEAEFQERLNNTTQQLHAEVADHISRFAEEKGYDLVLKISREKIAAETQEELKLKIHTRGVLWGRKALDLTDEIIRLLNKK